jgi:hypothetical protein
MILNRDQEIFGGREVIEPEVEFIFLIIEA